VLISLCFLDNKFSPFRILKGICHCENVFVASSGLVDHNRFRHRKIPGLLKGLNKCVGRFKGRYHPLFPDGQGQGVDHLLIGGGLKPDPSGLFQMGQDGRNTHIIKPGGNTVGLPHLPVPVLEKISFVSLGNPDAGIAT